jgi:hypothetical protein
MKKIILLIFVAFAIISCRDKISFNKRIVSEMKLHAINHFEYEDGNLIRMTADNNNIYLSSSPDNSIKVFNYTGKLCKTIGKEGPAPWENGTIWSFGKEGSCYWLHDYPKMALKKYDTATDTMLYYRRFITKHNVLFLKNDQFLVPYFKSESGIFYISLYDALKDSIIKEVDICKITGRFQKLPPYGDFTFQGNFCKNNNGQAIFYCMYNSTFFFIENNLKKVTAHTDIRNLPISEPITSGQRTYLDPNNVGIISGSMDKKYIYLLAPKYHETRRNRIKEFMIDVYDISTKNYLKSFEVLDTEGRLPIEIVKTDKGLVIGYYGGTIVIYDNDFVKGI